MKELNIKKLYYSISEVSKMTSLKPYVLRYWESEFPELHPSKNRAGNRIYRSNDIRIVHLIKKLLYSEKYTIEGAKLKLTNLISRNNRQLDISFNNNIENIIDEIRRELISIKDILENNL